MWCVYVSSSGVGESRGSLLKRGWEQVREVEGEAAYQERKRARDKAWQPRPHSPRPSLDQLRPRGPERDIGFER